MPTDRPITGSGSLTSITFRRGDPETASITMNAENGREFRTLTISGVTLPKPPEQEGDSYEFELTANFRIVIND